ncbi:hypothetical protein ABPG72_020610 [Tetrahymena utriculariae]
MTNVSQPGQKYLMEKLKKTISSQKLIKFMNEKQSWRKENQQFWFPFQIQEEREGKDVYFYLIYEDIRNDYAPIYQLLDAEPSDSQEDMTLRLNKLRGLISFVDKLHDEQQFIFDISLQNIWVSKYQKVEGYKYKILNRGIYQFYIQNINDKDILDMILNSFLNVFEWKGFFLVNKPFLGKYLSCQQSYECKNCNQFIQRNSICEYCEQNQNLNCKYCIQLKKMDCQRNQDLNALFILLYYMTYPTELTYKQHDDFPFEQQKFGNIQNTDQDKHFYTQYFQNKKIFTIKILEKYFDNQIQNVKTGGMQFYQLTNGINTTDFNQTKDYNQPFFVDNKDTIDQNFPKTPNEISINFTVSTQQTQQTNNLNNNKNSYIQAQRYDNKIQFFDILNEPQVLQEKEYELYIVMFSILNFNNYCVKLEELKDMNNQKSENNDLVVLQIQIFWQLIQHRYQKLKDFNCEANKLLNKLNFMFDQIRNDRNRIEISCIFNQYKRTQQVIKNLNNNIRNNELKMEISTINQAIKQRIQKKFNNNIDFEGKKYFKLISYFKQILFCQTFSQNNDMNEKFEIIKRKITLSLQNLQS